MSRTKPRCVACGSADTSRQCDGANKLTGRMCGRYLCKSCGRFRGHGSLDFCPEHAPLAMRVAARARARAAERQT